MATYIDMGAQALEMGRHDEAELLARRVLVHEPGSVDALSLMAAALLGQGREQEALNAAREAVRNGPADWQAHYQLGRILSAFGRIQDLNEALRHAHTASRIAPTVVEPVLIEAYCLNALGKSRRACQAYSRAVRIDPDNPLVVAGLAGFDLEQRKLRRAGQEARGLLASGSAPSSPLGSADPARIVDSVVVEQLRDLCFASLVLTGVLFAMSSEKVAPEVRAGTLVTFWVGVAAVSWRMRHDLPEGSRWWPRGLLGRVSMLDRAVVVGLPVFAVFALIAGFVPDDRSQDLAAAMIWVVYGGGGFILLVLAVAEVTGGVRRARRLRRYHGTSGESAHSTDQEGSTNRP